MLDVYVCEDDKRQLELFTKCISDTILIEALDMRIVQSVSDPHIIIDSLSSTDHTGIFFLDIELKSDMDGLRLAREIRRVQPRCFIIFITSHSEMSFLTFQHKLEALDFIIKDTSIHIKQKIRECLLNIQEKYAVFNDRMLQCFHVKLGGRCLSINYQEIIFFETSDNIHKIILHLKSKIIEFSGQLSDIEKQLDHHFFRCHRSYIINRDNMKAVDFNNLTVTMNNGEICPISTRQKRKMKHLILKK